MSAGLKFWKVNSTKFFAVAEEDLLAPRRKKYKRRGSGTDAIDLCREEPGCSCQETEQKVSKELVELQRRVDKVFQLTKDAKVPLGLRDLLSEAFKCKICREVIRPPVIVTKCCKGLLGCDECVRTWYATDPLTKNCPGCNTERGYVETMRIRGLDDLITAVRTLEDL